MINNLKEILKNTSHKDELEIIYFELLDFMQKNDWRGACHESCGVQYVLLKELGINCIWKLGEIEYKDRTINGRAICFDHSWLLIDGEIFDAALWKPSDPEFDLPPTINGRSLKTLEALGHS
jgi:hypothetical protein